MISRLTGILIEKHPPYILIDINGIAYEAEVSMQTYYTLPEIGQNIQLYTQQIIREDAHLLFAFANKEERQMFRQLIKVSGIGAKTALGVLSTMTSEELVQAITQENIKQLSAAPGIGKKTAERMILELRDKLSPIAKSHSVSLNTQIDTHQDIIDTLLALGYSEREAKQAIQNIPMNTDISEGVRSALKNITK